MDCSLLSFQVNSIAPLDKICLLGCGIPTGTMLHVQCRHRVVDVRNYCLYMYLYIIIISFCPPLYTDHSSSIQYLDMNFFACMLLLLHVYLQSCIWCKYILHSLTHTHTRTCTLYMHALSLSLSPSHTRHTPSKFFSHSLSSLPHSYFLPFSLPSLLSLPLPPSLLPLPPS